MKIQSNKISIAQYKDMMQDEKLTFGGALLMPEQYFAHNIRLNPKITMRYE